jgi:nitrogen fixation protein FixH
VIIYSIIKRIRGRDTVVTKEMELMIHGKTNLFCLLNIVRVRYAARFLHGVMPQTIQTSIRFNDDTTADWHDATSVPIIQQGRSTVNTSPIIYVFSETYNESGDIDKLVHRICMSRPIVENGKHNLESSIKLRSDLCCNRSWADDVKIKEVNG